MKDDDWSIEVYTYTTDSLLNLVDATPGDKSRRFRYEFIDIALASVPMMYGHIAHIAHIA